MKNTNLKNQVVCTFYNLEIKFLDYYYNISVLNQV